MNEEEKLELIGLRAFYNYFFDNLYAEGYEVIDTWGNPEGVLSDFIDAAYDAKVQAETLAGLGEPNKLTIDTSELPTWANWIDRDKDGKLWVYEYTPYKTWKSWFASGDIHKVEGDSILLGQIKWEDEEPTKIVRRQLL